MKYIPKTMLHVYLAGKIGYRDWRHSLVPGLRNAGAMVKYPPPLDCKTFVYTGPFFASDDHGTTHGDGCHGNCEGCLGDVPITKPELFARNNAAIRSADLIVAYINAYDCIGTCCEITYAYTLGKKIMLIFGPEIKDRNEFWYLAQMGEVVRARRNEPLVDIFAHIIREASR